VGIIISVKDIQVYCERCKTSSWITLDLTKLKELSGLMKRAIIHNDHVLLAEIDGNGSVRSSTVIEVEFNPMQTLIEDVGQGLHYLNSEAKTPILIDAYTSNRQFKKFIQSIIVEMFKQSTSRRLEDRFKFVAANSEERTTLHTDHLHLSVGPYIKPDFEGIKHPYKGIILDIVEAEKNKLDIEATLGEYDWVALIVQKEKKEGYFHAFSSLFEETGTPFFIETLNNQSLRELFDFIFAITLQVQA